MTQVTNKRILHSAITGIVIGVVLIALAALVLNIHAKVLAGHGATVGYWPQTFRVSGAIVTATLFVVAVTFLYLLPAILGWRTPNRVGIVAVNLFAGWTVAGWVVALVWALTKRKE